MSRNYLTLLLAVLFTAGTLSVSGQDIRKTMSLQDLVGDWGLVAEDTRVPGGKRDGNEILRIAVEDSEVTIFRRFEDEKGFIERTFVYFADGRGENNRWTSQDGTVMEQKTKTTWKKGVLLRKGSYKMRQGLMDSEERCRLSNDLQKLECDQLHRRPGARSLPFERDFTNRLIYKRI